MGADNRLFRHFHLPNGKVHHLDWIHHGKSKTLAEYATLMAERITTENNVIVGSSMGGMVTVEISKLIRPLGAALVSAPTGRHEFPQILKNLSAIKLHKALRPHHVMRVSTLADLFMGFKTEDQRAMFYDMLRGNGADFLYFSVGAVLDWKNTTPPDVPFIQIIGTQDRLFKQEKIPGAIMIEGSGHFTAFEKGKEVSAIITDWTKKLMKEIDNR